MDALIREVLSVPFARMRSLVRSTGLPLVLLLAGVTGGLSLWAQIGGSYPASPGSPTAAPQAPVTVSGVVVNAVTGKPVPRALVQLGVRVMLTDHDGKFEFDQYAEASATIQVRKPGYYASRDGQDGGGTYLLRSQMGKPIRLRLYPEALLTGTVTAPDGSPLAQIMVGAMQSTSDQNGRRWAQVASSQTNARGEFRLPIPAGEYRLETYQARDSATGNIVMPVIFPDNSSDNSSGIFPVRNGEELHFGLHPAMGPGYRVSVTDEPSTGFPTIRVRKTNGPWFQVGAMRVAQDGSYQLELPTGTYTLAATKYSQDGAETAETTVTVAGHDVSGVVLRFSPIQTVPVEMSVDPAASDNATTNVNPPEVLSLGLMLRSVDTAAGMGAMSGASRQKDGTVEFHVSPGSYRLRSFNTGGQWFVQSATYGDRDLLRQEMTVAPGGGGVPIELTVSNQTGSLEGMVSLKGAPCSCPIFLIPSASSLTPFGSNWSNIAGRYQVNMAPGTYQVVALEKYHMADYSDPAALAPFAGHVRTVTIHAQEKTTLELDAVPEEEAAP